ncbi:MAG: hypothetical protein MJY59_06015 [Bacteroidaceae bacterium]|nr:hypothetical protein [Bacteroidaceae bacterium]
MKANLFKYGLMTLLMAFAITLCFSCDRDNEEEIKNPESTDDQQGMAKEEPTEDLKKEVLYTMSTVYGTPSTGFATSLVSRFQTIEAYNECTKVCVITDEAIRTGKVKRQDYLNIYDCFSDGGVIIFLSPTHEGLNEVFPKGLAEALNSRSTALFNMKVDGEKPNPDSGDHYLTQVQIPEDGSKVWSCLGFSKKDILYCEDVDGDGQTGESKATPYQIGIRADAVVRWVNELLASPNVEGIEDEIARAKSSVNFVHDIHYYDVGKQVYGVFANSIFTQLRTSKGTFVETIYYVSAHDIGTHTDYYLITQDAEFDSKKLGCVYDINDTKMWWTWDDRDLVASDGSKIGTLKEMYIHHFLNWESKLGVRMSGKSINIHQSSPQADNDTSSETTTVTNGTMESHTNGLSIGSSFGASMGSGLTAMITASYNHSWTTGTTHTVGVGSTRNKKDITISKDVDREGQTVTWTYNGRPGSYRSGDGWWHWNVGNLQVSSMQQTNSMLVSIPDVTSGSATLTIDNKCTYRTMGFVSNYTIGPSALLFNPDVKDTFGYVDAITTDHREIELPRPFRFTQTWLLNCISYGDMKSSTDKSNLWADVEKNMLSNSSIFLIAENTADGTASACELMNVFMEDFAARAPHYQATYNASGKFKFQLTRRDGSGDITAEYDIR